MVSLAQKFENFVLDEQIPDRVTFSRFVLLAASLVAGLAVAQLDMKANAATWAQTLIAITALICVATVAHVFGQAVNSERERTTWLFRASGCVVGGYILSYFSDYIGLTLMIAIAIFQIDIFRSYSRRKGISNIRIYGFWAALQTADIAWIAGVALESHAIRAFIVRLLHF